STILICLFNLFDRGMSYSAFFFFQAEEGIGDRNVTGVQTCALPISLCRNSQAGRIVTLYNASFGERLMSAVRKQLAIRIKRPEFFRVINGFSSKVENHFFFTAELKIGRASGRERVWSTVGSVVVWRE